MYPLARKLRVEYPGAIYHVMNQGDRREPIFLTDEDRMLFLDTQAETCRKTGWQALCLIAKYFPLDKLELDCQTVEHSQETVG